MTDLYRRPGWLDDLTRWVRVTRLRARHPTWDFRVRKFGGTALIVAGPRRHRPPGQHRAP